MYIFKKKIDKLKNFGFSDEITIEECGINGKMNEIQSAFGLINLKYIDENIKEREKIDNFYRKGLGVIRGIRLFNLKNQTSYNYSYFPILVDDLYPETRDELYFRLKEADIFSRRYFFPLISSMPMYKSFLSASVDNLPNSNFIANKILCLPIYPGLKLGQLAFERLSQTPITSYRKKGRYNNDLNVQESKGL